LEELRFEVCGGYRRGKDMNGDVDALVSCRKGGKHRVLREGIRRELAARFEFVALKEAGASDGFAKSSDPHEKLEHHDNGLFLIRFNGLFRRLDVIVPPPEQWAFCVLGWSGTKQMEKDLRDYAKVRQSASCLYACLYVYVCIYVGVYERSV
jgi:DNA polymerase mu